MVKPLTFKGDKKPAKKRKRTVDESEETPAPTQSALSKRPQDAAATPHSADDDDTWVSADASSDIAGPVILVLSTPSHPPSCIAVDAMGRVFLAPIENMIDGDPSTSEPHDVRQVWISQRIVGSENTFTFKGHHGRYLGCDSVGVVAATREAVSQEETFNCAPWTAPEGTTPALTSTTTRFTLQTALRKTYITLGVSARSQQQELRGDGETISAPTPAPETEPNDDEVSSTSTSLVHVRMQARFKPRLVSEKAEKVRAKISRKELEEQAGRSLTEEEVKRLKKARREGDYYEAMLDVKMKSKHDKFA